ncbi:hypothetical protein BASA83_010418 [Batrachochytrium salamandrivorans]|nr:hypothetical protein BASA83_010418 [Batrachochytrium salamandrivorans]
MGPITFSVDALLDSGSDESLIDEDLALQHCVPLVPLVTPIALFLADAVKTYLRQQCTSVQINQVSTIKSWKLTDQTYPYISNSSDTSNNFPPSLIDKFSSVFDKAAAQALPAHSEHDFAIDLEPGFKPPHGKVYSLTPPETSAMNEYVRDNLEKGFIRRQNHLQQLHAFL